MPGFDEEGISYEAMCDGDTHRPVTRVELVVTITDVMHKVGQTLEKFNTAYTEYSVKSSEITNGNITHIHDILKEHNNALASLGVLIKTMNEHDKLLRDKLVVLEAASFEMMREIQRLKNERK